MLDRWRSYVIDAGADVGDVGPGLSVKEIRQMESKVGFEFVPQVVEFLSWGVCTHRYGSRFFPTPGTWSPPRRIVADTIGMREHSLVESCKEMGEVSGIAAGSDDELLMLWSNDVAYAVDHHRDGPTLGGLWCIDEADFYWAAKDLRGLVSAFLRMADHDLLVVDEFSTGRFFAIDFERLVGFAAELDARFAETAPPDHPALGRAAGFVTHLTYRWEIIDNPDLWTFDCEWVW